MKFVLVYGSLAAGGIETLILRLAKHLDQEGYDVTVCYDTYGQLVDLMPGTVRLVKFNGTRSLVSSFTKFEYEYPGKTIVLSFDPISAGRALLVHLALAKYSDVHHLSGVFHPRAYFMTEEKHRRRWLNRLVAKGVGYEHLFFMNEEVRANHAAYWRVDLSSTAVLPLPINEAPSLWEPSDASSLNIVSVGRLVDFKGYNLGAASIVDRCRKAGISVNWDIYGTGPLLEAVQSEIRKHSVGDLVRLRGELPYQDFRDVISRYDLFIGVGTAALEAAVLGVPTICATDTDPQMCYGYLHELPFGNVGELQPRAPHNRFDDLIMRHAKLDVASREKLSSLSRSTAMRYAMPEFLQQIIALANRRAEQPPPFLRWVAGTVYKSGTEGMGPSIFRAVRRLISQKAP